MTSFFAPRGEGWAMMTEDDKRGVKNGQFLDAIIYERPLIIKLQ